MIINVFLNTEEMKQHIIHTQTTILFVNGMIRQWLSLELMI